MPHEKVVHCKRSKYDEYIGRPSVWGNPFTVEEYGRLGAVKEYERWLWRQEHLLKRLNELYDKVLGCWCAPLYCHGEVLVKFLYSQEISYVMVRQRYKIGEFSG